MEADPVGTYTTHQCPLVHTPGSGMDLPPSEEVQMDERAPTERGALVNNKISGRAQVELKQQVTATTPTQSDKWWRTPDDERAGAKPRVVFCGGVTKARSVLQ